MSRTKRQVRSAAPSRVLREVRWVHLGTRHLGAGYRGGRRVVVFCHGHGLYHDPRPALSRARTDPRPCCPCYPCCLCCPSRTGHHLVTYRSVETNSPVVNHALRPPPSWPYRDERSRSLSRCRTSSASRSRASLSRFVNSSFSFCSLISCARFCIAICARCSLVRNLGCNAGKVSHSTPFLLSATHAPLKQPLSPPSASGVETR